MAAAPQTLADLGADKLRLWRERPEVMVRELFGVVPDAWQDQALAAFPRTPQLALKACKGPGKTTTLAWLAWNFLLTRPHPKIAATSISGPNLQDNLWAELSKWQQCSPYLLQEFELTSKRITYRRFPDTWFMSARTWAKTADKQQQANTLAGLHADYVMALLDESGGIPDSVMATAEAIHSSAKESHIVQAGNPTHLEGPLYRACTKSRERWEVITITGDPDDPLRSPRVSVDWARAQIQEYGRTNPWVLVNVFGEFPPASINALIGPDEIERAQQRNYTRDAIEFAARVLGVDVARFGDDPCVMYPRQGLVLFEPLVARNLDSIQGAGWVANKWAQWDADAALVDATGGWGAGWCDNLRQLGRQPLEVQFAGEPFDKRYFNKRTEMYFDACAWIREHGQLPVVPELQADLTTLTYTFKGDRMLLMEKSMLKTLLSRSCDHSDAFACTFAFPVHKRPRVFAPGVALGVGGVQSGSMHRSSLDEDPHQDV